MRTFEEISRIMGISVGSVRTLYYRAIHKIRNLLRNNKRLKEKMSSFYESMNEPEEFRSALDIDELFSRYVPDYDTIEEEYTGGPTDEDLQETEKWLSKVQLDDESAHIFTEPDYKDIS